MNNENMENVTNSSKNGDDIETPTTIAPWHLFMECGFIGRIAICVALPFAIFSVTIASVEPFIAEGLTGYISVLFLLWLAIIDAKYFKLPNKILLAWLMSRTTLMLFSLLVTGDTDIFINSIIGAVVMGLFFLITYYASKRTLGGGDIKLSFVLGLSVTISMVFSAVFYGLIICAIFALGALALKRLKRRDPIPLGPFIFIGTVITYLMEGL